MADLYTHEFVWPAEAASVIVTGTFDDWKSTVQLTKGQDGRLTATLPIKYGEKIAYKYVVDGNWQHSPAEPTETDSAGNTNNVFTAPDAPVAVPIPQAAEEPVMPVPAAVATTDAATLAPAQVDEPAAQAPAVTNEPAATETKAPEPVDEKKEDDSILNVATAGVAALATGAAALAGKAVSSVTGSSSPLTLVSSKDEPTSPTVTAQPTKAEEISKEPAPTPAVVPATSAAVPPPPAPAAVDQALENEKKNEKGSSVTAPVVTAVAGGAAAVGAGAAVASQKTSEAAAGTQQSTTFQRAESYAHQAAVEADKYKDRATTEFNKRYEQGEKMAHDAYNRAASSSFGTSTMKALGLDKGAAPQPQSVTASQPVVPAAAVAPAIPLKDTKPSTTSAPAAAAASKPVGVSSPSSSVPAHVAASSATVPAASQAPAMSASESQTFTTAPSTPVKTVESAVKNKFGNHGDGLGHGSPASTSSSTKRKTSFFKKLFGKDKEGKQ